MGRMESRYHNTFSILRDLTILLSAAAVLVLLVFGVSTVPVTLVVVFILAFLFVRWFYRGEIRWLRHHTAGVEAYSRGDTNTAEWHFRKSADYARRFPRTDNRLGQALSNIGAVSESRGHFDEAGKLYTEALAIYERSSGPGINRAPSVRASLERIAEAAVQHMAPVSVSPTERVIETAARIPEVGQALHQLAELQDQLIYPDPMTYPQLIEKSLKLLPSIVSGCGLDLGSSKEPLNVVKWLMASAVELDYYARREHKESERVRGAAAGCVKPIGSVFLSWTIRSPRERTAMRGMKFALDYFNLSYFDYTRCRADESRDEAAAITERLQAAIKAASCSLELMSSEFGSEWIDHERRLLRSNTSLPRVVLCLDSGAQFIRSEDEHRIVRIDVSDGRPVVTPTGNETWMQAASHDSYYRTDTYLSKALTLGRTLRECHETGDFSSLRSRLVGPSPNVRELRAFMGWIER